jgi:type II secretory pathway component GspD/PulD (secretin)
VELYKKDGSDKRSLFRSAFGLSNAPSAGATPNTSGVPDIPFATVSKGATFGFINSGKGFVGLMKAFEQATKARILARPILLTTDAESATFSSTLKMPIAQRSTGSNPNEVITTFGNYVDAGVKLTIKPYIRGAHVHMEVEQEISGFTGGTSGSSLENLPPPKFERTIKAMVDVPDEQITVIGGITRSDQTKDTSGVPFLSRIPLLGELFKNRANEATTTTVYLFLAPHVMRLTSFADLEDETLKRVETLERANKSTIPDLRQFKMGLGSTGEEESEGPAAGETAPSSVPETTPTPVGAPGS